MGGNFRFAVANFFITNSSHPPYVYSYFAASFLDKAHRCLSTKILGGKCGYERIKGKTEDISIFRFP